MRLKAYKMVTSILLKFLTLEWDILKTIKRIKVSDGSFSAFFRLFYLSLTYFFDRSLTSMFNERAGQLQGVTLYGDETVEDRSPNRLQNIDDLALKENGYG